jgi:sugar/nucleoside kinase (ribokinase family)
MFDVLGIGVVTIDTLLAVDAYPLEDTKIPIRARHRRLGGLTGAALSAAARFGARCAYAGLLGQNPASDAVRALLAEEGIDLAHVVDQPDAGPVESYILVAAQNQTRTILHDSNRPGGTHPSLPEESVIRQARVLYGDHHSVEGMIRAARVARAAGIPVVADLERVSAPRFEELLALVDHLILSYPFATRLTGEREPEAMLAALWREDRALLAVTRGEQGVWWRSAEAAQTRHQAAYRVEVVDTTGCGDVFHGVYAALLAWNRPARERIRGAAAAAAVKAAQWQIPTRAQVEDFLRSGQAPST